MNYGNMLNILYIKNGYHLTMIFYNFLKFNEDSDDEEVDKAVSLPESLEVYY